MITRDLRHLRAGDRGHHLGAVLGDAAGFVFLADHEAGDVLQEQQRNAALAAQLDEMRALQRAFGEQDAVVGEDADRDAVRVRKAGDQRRAVERLELVELASRRPAARSLRARRMACRGSAGTMPYEFGGSNSGGSPARRSANVDVFAAVQIGDDAPHDRQRMRVVLGIDGRRRRIGAHARRRRRALRP